MKPKNLLDDNWVRIVRKAWREVFNRIARTFSYHDSNERFSHVAWAAARRIYFRSSIYFFSLSPRWFFFFLLALRFSPARAPNRTFSRTKTFPINYGPLAGASARYLISYLSLWIDLKYVFQACDALILLDVETFSIHCWDLDEKRAS